MTDSFKFGWPRRPRSPRRGAGRRLFDSPWLPVALTALAYLLVLVVVLRRHDFHPGALVQAGEGFADRASVPPGLVVWPNTNGYDGQFYYRLALDPFTGRAVDFGVTLDNGAYRQQRVLYPLLAWLASLGRPSLVPAALVAVNYVGLLALALVGWGFARSAGIAGLWGLALPLFAGFVYTLIRDLTEIVAMACLFGGLLMVRRGRDWPAAALLTLAVLARETTLVAVGAVALVWLWQRAAPLRERRLPLAVAEGRGKGRFRQSVVLLETEDEVPSPQPSPGGGGRTGWPVWVAPALVFGLWQAWLWWRWGQLPGQAVRGAVVAPFAKWFEALAAAAALATYEQQRWFVELVVLAVLWVAGWLLLARSRALPHEKLAWALYALLATVLGADIWSHDLGFLRPLSEFAGLTLLLLFGGTLPLRAPLVAAHLALWFLVTGHLILFYR